MHNFRMVNEKQFLGAATRWNFVDGIPLGDNNYELCTSQRSREFNLPYLVGISTLLLAKCKLYETIWGYFAKYYRDSAFEVMLI